MNNFHMNTQSTSIRWIFKKNCSFSPKQVGLFYIAQSLFSLLVAGFFLWQGVWLILPFTLVELFILAILLLLYARHATDYEEIEIQGNLLIIRSVIGSEKTEFIANVAWLKLSKELTKSKLIGIQYQGKLKEIGRFIHVQKRPEFRHQLEAHL